MNSEQPTKLTQEQIQNVYPDCQINKIQNGLEVLSTSGRHIFQKVYEKELYIYYTWASHNKLVMLSEQAILDD